MYGEICSKTAPQKVVSVNGQYVADHSDMP